MKLVSLYVGMWVRVAHECIFVSLGMSLAMNSVSYFALKFIKLVKLLHSCLFLFCTFDTIFYYLQSSTLSSHLSHFLMLCSCRPFNIGSFQFGLVTHHPKSQIVQNYRLCRKIMLCVYCIWYRYRWGSKCLESHDTLCA